MTEELCCADCFHEVGLRKLIRKYGDSPKGPCHYCGSTKARTIQASELEKRFFAVVGEHYVEHDNLSQYRHEDPGNGEALSWIMDEDFDVFSDEVEEKEDLLSAILNSSCDYTGPQVFERNGSWFRIEEDWGHRSLSNLHNEALDTLIEAIQIHGHNIVTLMNRGKLSSEVFEAYQEIVGELTHSTRTLPVGEVLWRARVGKWTSPDDIKPPPAHLAKAGRCNHGGQPVLYVASKRETAVSEVRPAKKDVVTVAEFTLVRKAAVCNLIATKLMASPFTHFKRHQKEMRARALADTVGLMLATPIRPGDEPKEYLATQVICRMIFDKGFDGIKYQSAQDDGGVNLVFLEPGIATPKASPFDHVTIKSVTYKTA